jgi:citronellyl-CoA dehydrogenase
MWITNSLQADWMCMLVNTGEGPVHKNKSLVIVPMRENGKLRKGIEVAKKIRKIGMNSSDTGLIYFDEVRVPQRYRIGARARASSTRCSSSRKSGSGRGQLPAVADQLHPVDGRVGAGAQAVRRRAGRPAMGAVQAGRDEDRGRGAARADLPRLRPLCAGPGRAELASMAKLKAGRLNRLVPDTCLQFWGGMGYTWENKVARMFRDGRLASIGGGADEVMMGILAKLMGIAKRPKPPDPGGA